MGSLRERKGLLFFDFRYKGIRCREQTALSDTAGNRKKLAPILERIESTIKLGTFRYEDFFPDSIKLKQFADDILPTTRREVLGISAHKSQDDIPLFRDFCEDWLLENEIRWKRSHRKLQRAIMDNYLIPAFGELHLDEIDRGMILKFRGSLSKEGISGKPLGPVRINHIMTPLKMILTEASERFGFHNPAVSIRALKVPHSDVDPFSIQEVKFFLENIRPDFKNYYTTRFFTGARTAEVDGLQWKFVDFERRQILIRETLVDSVLETTKTPGSVREIHMSQMIYDALINQFEATGSQSEFVFCNKKGNPLRHRDVSKRIWYPALRYMGLKPRKPYQTRHTAATLWLASGENPEWIARQMGHTTTRMLFTVYSRFVPNLTRKDGSAFERLMITTMKGDDHE